MVAAAAGLVPPEVPVLVPLVVPAGRPVVQLVPTEAVMLEAAVVVVVGADPPEEDLAQLLMPPAAVRPGEERSVRVGLLAAAAAGPPEAELPLPAAASAQPRLGCSAFGAELGRPVAAEVSDRRRGPAVPAVAWQRGSADLEMLLRAAVEALPVA